MKRAMRIELLSCALLFVACAHSPSSPSASETAQTPQQSTEAIVAAPDRTADDKALDEGRQPAQTLAFVGVRPGMKVAELFAGRGYSTELLARAVGPEGKVYGQNSPMILQKFAEKPWSERLAKPVMQNVVRVDRELDDPLPPEANNLDVVFSNAIYHDAVWLNADRNKMNAAVFKALKPGGVYVVIDSSAVTGSGIRDVQTLHRIDEQVVRQEVQAAGFKLAEESNFLRHPEDTRDWNVSPSTAGAKRGTGDRFALKFVKP